MTRSLAGRVSGQKRSDIRCANANPARKSSGGEWDEELRIPLRDRRGGQKVALHEIRLASFTQKNYPPLAQAGVGGDDTQHRLTNFSPGMLVSSGCGPLARDLFLRCCSSDLTKLDVVEVDREGLGLLRRGNFYEGVACSELWGLLSFRRARDAGFAMSHDQ